MFLIIPTNNHFRMISFCRINHFFNHTTFNIIIRIHKRNIFTTSTIYSDIPSCSRSCILLINQYNLRIFISICFTNIPTTINRAIIY